MRIDRRSKLFLSLGAAVVIAWAAMAVSTSPADARPGPIGGPLCGWSAIWTCTLPDGTEKTVIGTQCDIARIENATGATCEIN